MQIALFSDIHANLPALEAFFADIDKRKPDAIYCLGDLVGYNIWPNEVINKIRLRRIATIAGNHDLKVKMAEEGDAEIIIDGKNFAYQLVGKEEKDYLLSLPSSIRLTFTRNEITVNILLVHGSPRSVNEYIFEEMEESDLLELMKTANADILCFGHTHKPYHRVVESKKEGVMKFCHAINTGSVGKPKDGNSKGGYVLLTINQTVSLEDKDSIKVEFVRFEYDTETAAKAIENSPLPNELAEMLRKGY